MERTNIFNEIVETESKYLDSLTQLNTIYIQQIQSKKFFELKKDMNETVKNLSIIINFNGFLLKGLKEETAKENVGAIFCKIIPFLKTYTAYFNHYTGATSQVREERKRNKAFDEWLKKTETAAKKDGKQPFLSYLIMPVQRIPRYSLLLKELKGSTDQSHPDYPNLDKALDETKKVADYLNERIKDQDLQSRMLFIERNVMNMGNYEKVSLTAPHRRFVHELVVVFDDMEQVQLFVFSDLLLVCSKASEEQRTQYLMYHDNAKNGVNSGSQSARRKSGKRQSSSLSNIDTKNAPEFCIMFFIELSCTPAPSVQNFAGFPSRSNVLLLSTENESHLIVAQDKESAAELEACLTKVLAKLVSNAGLDPSDKSNYAPVSYYNLPSDMVEYVIQQNQIATSSPITPVEEKHTKIVLDSPSEASSSDSTSSIVPQIQLTADSSAESIFGERKRAPLDVVTKTKMKTPRRKATVQKSPVDILDTLENKVELPDSDKKFVVEEALVKVEEEPKDNVPKAARFGGIAMPGMGMPGLGDALKRRQAKMEEKAEPEQKSEPVETKSEPEPESKPVEPQPETQQVEQTPVEPIQVEVKQPKPVVETKDSPTDSPTQEGGRRRKKKLELKQKQKQQEKERLEKEKREVEEEKNRQQQEQAAAEEEERKKQAIAAEEEERKRQEAQQQAADEDQRKLEELEKERVENEKAAQEKVEKERLEREANEKLERERTENEEAERLERERLEKERVEKEETERLEKKRAEVEEAQRLEKQRLEAEKEQLEKDEAQRIEDEKLETQRIESERLEKEKLEADKLESERLEKQRLEEERLEKERIEKERLAKLEEERLEKERIEQERLEKEKLERERVEQERVEQQRLQKEQDERDRLQRLKEEQEAASEAERQLLIQIEKERVEREEARRIEAERLKAERIAEKKRQYEREQALIREQELLELMRQKKEEQDKRERERIEQQRQQQLLEEEDRKKLQAQLNEILSNIKRVEKKIREEKDSAENWMKEAKKQGTTLFQLKTTNEQLQQQINDARHGLSRDESVNNERVNSFEERIANVQNEIEGFKKSIEEEKAASDELSARESHLNEELRKIESRIDKERALQADMKSERVKFNKLSADVNIELVKYGSRLTRENTSKVALDKELADLQMNLDREKKLISRLEDQLKKEQLDREELYEEVQSSTQEYKETESENAKLFEQLSFLKGQLTGQTKSKSTSKYDLETQTYQLQRLIRDAEYKLDREKQDQKTSLQQKRKIELQLEQVREEVEELREETSSLQQSIVDNEKDIDKFNSKIDEHMTKQIMMKREIEKLKNLERDLSSKITNAEFEIRKESREIQSLRAQLRALEMRASITPFNY